MTDLLALTGHSLHLLVVLGGLVGMAAILAPRLADRAGLLRAPDSALDRRVAALRERAATGTLGRPVAGDPAPGRASAAGTLRRDGPLAGPGDSLLGAAVVGSAAAAGVHAAVGPMHLADYPLLAVGLLLAAVLQGAWPLAVLATAGRQRDEASTDRTAVAGVLVQGGCLAAWAISRTVGLPAVLHGAGAQPVGPWDLAAVAWQLVALAWCLAHLAGRRPTAGPGLRPGWATPAARAFLGGSAVVLVLLTLSGASA